MPRFKEASTRHGDITGRQFPRQGITMSREEVAAYATLAGFGMYITDDFLSDAMDALERAPGYAELSGTAMDGDDVNPFAPTGNLTITTASVVTPVQFLQNWLPGFVNKLTAARKIDILIGMRTVGDWEEEQIVQGIMEPTGTAKQYGDLTNAPLMNYNANYDYRTNVRFEAGMLVSRLAAARAARVRISDDATKRAQAAVALEIVRNRVGFYGYNDGANKTYGFLNDPNLPAYQTVAAGASSSTHWSQKTTLEIINDLIFGMAQLQAQSQDRYNVEEVPVLLAVPNTDMQYLGTPTILGYSVRQWIRETYPKMRVESAPELVGANGGADVFYLAAEEVNDEESTDDKSVIIQLVPAKFITLGVEKRMKSYAEDYSNATAGAMVKRPYAVFRGTGI